MSRTFLLVISAAVLVGCYRGHSTVPVPHADVTLVRRTFVAPSPDYVRLGLGRVDVVLRRAEQPTVNLRGIQFSLHRDSTNTIIRPASDSLGVVRFDSLPVGQYTVQGVVAPIQVQVSVEAGCRTDVELYQGTSFIGIAPPPNMRARATVTTCPSLR